MKYRPTEQVIVDTLEKEIDKVNRKLENVDKAKRKAEHIYDLRANELSDVGFKMQQRISKINDRVKKRCKHTGKTHMRVNSRDDVDYTHRIICDDCGEQIGKYGSQTPYG